MLLNTQNSLDAHNRTPFVPEIQNPFVIRPDNTREWQPPEPHPQEVETYLLGQPLGCEDKFAHFFFSPVSLLLFVLVLEAIINIPLVKCLYLKVFPSSIQECLDNGQFIPSLGGDSGEHT